MADDVPLGRAEALKKELQAEANVQALRDTLEEVSGRTGPPRHAPGSGWAAGGLK